MLAKSNSFSNTFSLEKLLLFSFTFSTLITIISSTLQINLDDGRERCFVEELYSTSVASIKWKIELGSMVTLNKRNITKEEISQIIPENITKNTHIIIRDEESNEVIKTFSADINKGKNSFQSDKNGFYSICVRYTGQRIPNDNIYFSMKIHSNNMDEPKLNDALKTSDIDGLTNQINLIVEKGKEITNKQTTELEDEDKYAKLQMEITSNYNILNLIQVLVILALGIYQIWSFKKFLVANNLI